ncbi:GntR family transcriptional regulator [Marivita hallyeonensis]|uniref:Transcriptional regulator, GntR family n=1 Tax=Marivita hallyeonensis TaxID=996342 RepID=A0A1M5SBS7_9RHOB|nr:GntR family transcriptional regulator [Marivita hallyeonensis]SHH35929.1 transcriptional regulator, GntR family [Marivita hallyeonensis]
MPPATTEKTTAATTIYQDIKADILRGGFPAGIRLNIKDLAERYESSINPVREALSRLAAERIVDQREQKGFSIPVIDAAGLEELVKTRCWLEEIAVRESIANMTEDYELDLVTTFHRLERTEFSLPDGSSNPKWEERHRAFHLALIANCGSSWLLSFCDHLMFQATRARYLAVSESSEAGRLRNEEHKAIMDAVLAKDADRAVDLLKAHYSKTLALVREVLDQ